MAQPSPSLERPAVPGNESTDPRIRALGGRSKKKGGSGVMSYRPLNPAPMDEAVWVWGGTPLHPQSGSPSPPIPLPALPPPPRAGVCSSERGPGAPGPEPGGPGSQDLQLLFLTRYHKGPATQGYRAPLSSGSSRNLISASLRAALTLQSSLPPGGANLRLLRTSEDLSAGGTEGCPGNAGRGQLPGRPGQWAGPPTLGSSSCGEETAKRPHLS